MELKGTYTAIITPFENEQVDYNGLRNNIRFQIENGIEGILALGTTGETPTLTEDEQEKIIRITAEETKGKVPFMVGTGTNCTAKTIENTKRAKMLGADSVLVIAPYYNKPTAEGVYQHFKTITDSVDIPIVVYNIQGRTSINIETRTLQRISDLNNIIGVKEASRNFNQMVDVVHQIARKKKNFNVMSGDDALTVPLLSIGGKGVFSVTSNLIPSRVVEMVKSALDGNFSIANEIHHDLLPLFNGQYIETNPVPIKEAMNLCGLPAGGVRLPLVKMTEENRAHLKRILTEMKVI